MHQLTSQQSFNQNNGLDKNNEVEAWKQENEELFFQCAKWIYFDYFLNGQCIKSKDIFIKFLAERNNDDKEIRKTSYLEEAKMSRLENIKSSLSMFKGMKHKI